MTVSFLNVSPKSVKLRVLPKFPSQVTAIDPIVLTKSNGNYQFSFDANAGFGAGTTGTGPVVLANSPTLVAPSFTGTASFGGTLGMGITPGPSQLSVYGSSAIKQLSILDATRTQIVDGSAAAPVTSLGPSVLVSRYETLPSFSSQNAAIYGLNLGSSSSLGQSVALQGYAYQEGPSDCVALFGIGEFHGTSPHGAFGGFLSGLSFTPNSTAIALETQTDNRTGNDVPYVPDLFARSPSISMLGLDINYASTGSVHNGTAAVLIRSTGGQGKWDVGIGFHRYNGSNPTLTADIQTDSDAGTILLANAGAHTNGINLTGTGSTYSGNAFMSPNFSVSGAGNVSLAATTASISMTTGALIVAGGVGVSGTLTAATVTAAAGGGGLDLTNGTTIKRIISDGHPQFNSQSGSYEFTGTATASFAGAVLSSSPTGGVGYATGAGGTITQITSRTTGVILNKVSGAITMFSAAGSATAATFTVTNSAVAATDVIHLSQKSGTNLYNFLVTTVAAGSFNITFYTTGGTATDAPVINFVVIKGVTS